MYCDRNVLVTGGAGFVGSHLVDALVGQGYSVRVLDNLEPQVHGTNGNGRGNLQSEAELIRGDVRDLDTMRRALKGVHAVFHLAAAVGVGQSMYRVRDYVEVNSLGVANLLQILAEGRHEVEKLVVASSMSTYGEGAYRCAACGEVAPPLRPAEQLQVREWEVRCPQCGRPASAIPTAETKPLQPASVYAISKRDHEEMCLCVGRAYGIPTVALRYFNIYGPRQALSNPYTGAVAIFCSRLMNAKPPLVFEDGGQTRDFVHVSDVVRASMLALENDRAAYQPINVGTGRAVSILEMAELVRRVMGETPAPRVLGKFREGDIRHCCADISRARELLGYQPSVRLEDGLADLVEWLRDRCAEDRVEGATRELEQHGLTR